MISIIGSLLTALGLYGNMKNTQPYQDMSYNLGTGWTYTDSDRMRLEEKRLGITPASAWSQYKLIQENRGMDSFEKTYRKAKPEFRTQLGLA